MLKAMHAQETGEALLCLITIKEESLADDIRVTSDDVDTWSADQDTTTATDKSSSQVSPNDGTLKNDPTWSSDGPNDSMRGSLGFDLNNDSSNEHFSIGTDLGDPQKFTVEFWVNTQDPNIDGNNNYRQAVSAGEFFIVIEEGGSVSFRVPGVDTTNFIQGSVSFGSWSHVACVYDQSDRIIYVDGSEAGRETIGSGTVDLGSITVGGTSGGRAIPGDITDVRIWDVARTQSEIDNNKDSRLNGDESGLIGYWPLDDTTDKFVPFPFEFKFPDVGDDNEIQASLRISNVDRQIVQAVRDATDFPLVTTQFVLGSSPDTIEAEFPEFKLSNVRYDEMVVEGRLTLESPINAAYPQHSFTPGRFPGLF